MNVDRALLRHYVLPRAALVLGPTSAGIAAVGLISAWGAGGGPATLLWGVFFHCLLAGLVTGGMLFANLFGERLAELLTRPDGGAGEGRGA